ncbi:DUF3152 domain-containing protein [Catellatospora aurea]|uniref:DUF3152 domain-containing protein n=1 Tax=Catellatospora aurea TaxID=1337874 RepID=A0ABW2GYW9_9ACTN
MGRIFTARMTTVAVLALALAGCGTSEQPEQPAFQPAASPQPMASAEPSAAEPSPSVKPSPKPTKNAAVLERGEGTFVTAAGSSPVVGDAGTLRRYQVQVEEGITAFDPDGFAAVVEEVLADEHSWIASKKWRFQRVAPGASANFRIMLSTPGTTDRLCAKAGLQTNGIFSCRYGDNVVINLRRWTNGADGFTDMEVYRHMVINHEVGHFLGKGHVNCPGNGKLAPVMQQQTKSLQGCKPNPYPYPDGVHYVG